MVHDIRTTTSEDHWSEFETAWTALMTYRYLGKLSPELDAGVERETMPLRHDMRNATGGILAAPLCIASPEPHWLDSQCVPAPVVMSYEVLDPARDVRQVVIERDVIHLGRTMGYSRSRTVDADNPERVIAVSSGMGVSLGDVPDGYEKIDNPPIDVEDSPDLPRLHEVFGAERGADSLWRLPPLRAEFSAPTRRCTSVRSTSCSRWQRWRPRDHAGTDALQVESWHVMMERPGVTGPFRAEARVNGAASAALRSPRRSTTRARTIAPSPLQWRSSNACERRRFQAHFLTCHRACVRFGRRPFL